MKGNSKVGSGNFTHHSYRTFLFSKIWVNVIPDSYWMLWLSFPTEVLGLVADSVHKLRSQLSVHQIAEICYTFNLA